MVVVNVVEFGVVATVHVESITKLKKFKSLGVIKFQDNPYGKVEGVILITSL